LFIEFPLISGVNKMTYKIKRIIAILIAISFVATLTATAVSAADDFRPPGFLMRVMEWNMLSRIQSPLSIWHMGSNNSLFL